MTSDVLLLDYISCQKLWTDLYVAFLGAFTKLWKAAISVMSLRVLFDVSGCSFVCRLPLEEFSWNFIFEYFFENLLGKFNFH